RKASNCRSSFTEQHRSSEHASPRGQQSGNLAPGHQGEQLGVFESGSRVGWNVHHVEGEEVAEHVEKGVAGNSEGGTSRTVDNPPQGYKLAAGLQEVLDNVGVGSAPGWIDRVEEIMLEHVIKIMRVFVHVEHVPLQQKTLTARNPCLEEL